MGRKCGSVPIRSRLRLSEEEPGGAVRYGPLFIPSYAERLPVAGFLHKIRVTVQSGRPQTILLPF